MDAIFFDPHVRLLECWGLHLRDWSGSNLAAPYWRLYWNRTPGAWIGFAGQRLSLMPDKLYLIAPETPYSAHLDSPCEHYYLHFVARAPYTGLAPEVFVFAVTPDVRERLDALTVILRRSGRSAEPQLGMLALALAHGALARVPVDRLIAARPDLRLDAVLEHMERAPGAALRNADLARIACMNTNAFIRWFHEVQGRSPQAYYRSLRLNQACAMLQNSRKSIDEIAGACGFCDRYHFSRAFKQARGLGPAAFRRNQSLGEDGTD